MMTDNLKLNVAIDAHPLAVAELGRSALNMCSSIDSM
jgi:hypothetical protein